MESFSYPIDIEPDDNDTLLVTVPDLPGAVTFGEDRAAALFHALEVVEIAIARCIEEREDVPTPSPAAGRPTVSLPAVTAAKLAIYRALRETGTSKAELARRLGWHGAQVRRLLDIGRGTRMDHLERALAILGKRLEVRVRNAA